MTILGTAVDPRSAAYGANRSAMLEGIAELERALDAARSGGGERYVTRHHARGKLLPRERIELLVDRDAPFLELSTVAGWGTEVPVGAGVVTGIGVVEDVECVIVAHDPTVRDGEISPSTVKKIERAGEIALTNRLPLVNLVESEGPDPAGQAEVFVPGGRALRDLSRLSGAGVPTVCVVFGPAVAGGALRPALSDFTVLIRNQSKVYLADPAYVQAATGEATDDESLGGAAMHATRSGLADFVAEDDRDGIRLARQCVRRLNWTKLGPAPRTTLPQPPKHDPEDLLAIPSADPRVPFDPREVLGRVLDGSEFDEFKPAYGPALVTGWGELHGYPIGVLANARTVLCTDEARKAAHFIQLANAASTPLLFLPNTTGYLIGTEPEQRGILRHGALMLGTLANSTVPHLTVQVGSAYGTGDYAMGGRGHGPRFLFAWPNARSAATPPAERGSAALPADPESSALFHSGRLHDDGVIDPRDTRTVLGLCLSAIHSAPVKGAEGFGAFRM